MKWYLELIFKIILRIMDLIQEHNKRLEPMKIITGVAMKVHAKYKPGLLESAYEAAMEYLLRTNGHAVERQKPTCNLSRRTEWTSSLTVSLWN